MGRGPGAAAGASPERRLPSLVGPGPNHSRGRPPRTCLHPGALPETAACPLLRSEVGRGAPRSGPPGKDHAVRAVPSGVACPVDSAPQVEGRSEGDASELSTGANTSGYPETEREGGPREMERFRPALV